MEPETLVCGCGRTFSGPGPFNFHRRACKSRKRLLQGALSKVKGLWEQRKRTRLGERPFNSTRRN
jgi:hypothetical protein